MKTIYNYSELKGVIKVGHKVKKHGDIDDKSECPLCTGDEVIISQVNKDGFGFGKWYHRFIENAYLEILNLEQEKPVKVGDIIVSKNGTEAKVLEVLENTFLRSIRGKFDEPYEWSTFGELKNNNWTIKGQEETPNDAWLKTGKDNGWVEDGRVV